MFPLKMLIFHNYVSLPEDFQRVMDSTVNSRGKIDHCEVAPVAPWAGGVTSDVASTRDS